MLCANFGFLGGCNSSLRHLIINLNPVNNNLMGMELVEVRLPTSKKETPKDWFKNLLGAFDCLENLWSKKCNTCGGVKPLKEFSKDSRARSGFQTYCKKCQAESISVRHHNNKTRQIIVIPDFKNCPGCSVVKPGCDFYKKSSNKDGLQGWCRACEAKSRRKLRKENASRETVVVPDFKTCSRCSTEKHNSGFSRSNGNTDGLKFYCKECDTVRHRKQKYGLTDEQFNALLESQGGACVICKFVPGPQDGPLDVDHIHETDIVRGLLHRKCNRGLGLFKDSVDIIGKAIAYLNSPDLGIPYKKWLPKAIKDKILIAQNYLCKICSTDLHNKKACTDHDHLTNMIRGILCDGCNTGLGHFDDSVKLLTNAINYLNGGVLF